MAGIKEEEKKEMDIAQILFWVGIPALIVIGALLGRARDRQIGIGRQTCNCCSK